MIKRPKTERLGLFIMMTLSKLLVFLTETRVRRGLVWICNDIAHCSVSILKCLSGAC